jgi:lipoprotein-releasing system permease protein
MNFRLELQIAMRYLQSRKNDTFISITSVLSLVGITLGVAALIIVMSVMNGYRIELTNKLKGFNSDVMVRNFDQEIDSYQPIIQDIAKLSRVSRAMPVISEQSLIIKDNKATGAIVKAIRPKDSHAYSFLSKANKLSDPNGILLGEKLAGILGVKEGDGVKVISTYFNTTIVGSVPRVKDFKVEGVFSSGLSEYDSSYAMMGLEAGQKLFQKEDTVNSIEVFLMKGEDTEEAARVISRLLDHKYQVYDWKRMNQSLFNALKTERVVMFIILTFIIVVAAFNIISSLTMLVTEKIKEIAILRTIGFSANSIMRIFLYLGMVLGSIGTSFGVVIGLAFAHNIEDIKNSLSSIMGTNLFDPIVYYLDILPSHVDNLDVIKIVFLSLGVSLCATMYPSFKASRISPVEAMKND